MTTQVIRIEHPSDGNGLFRSVDDYDEARINKTDLLFHLKERHRDSFPTAYTELRKAGINLLPCQYCAFKSIASLQEWILPYELKTILELGFNILLLEVSHCIELEYQVVYVKSDVTSIRNINELFQ